MTAIGLAISVINFVAGALYVLILARILISWLPVSPWHPVVRWLRRIVDPVLAPFRRLLPSIGGIDLSPLLAILVIFFVARLSTQILATLEFGGGSIPVGQDVVELIGQLLLNILIILGILVLIRLLISLFSVSPWHPLVAGVRQMTDPLVRPFAGLAPHRRTYGYQSGFDVAALITLGVYIVLYVVITILFENVLPSVF